MKYLVLALLLCALLSLSNAGCFLKAPKQVSPTEKPMTHCQDHVDGTWHAVGSSWRNSQCLDCTCDGCCTAYPTPTRIPDDCVTVFDSEACEYIAHKKDDPTELCPILAGVGK